jgi:hypothetical protein
VSETDSPDGPFAGMLVLTIAALAFLAICALWGVGREPSVNLLALNGLIWLCGTGLRIVEVDRA